MGYPNRRVAAAMRRAVHIRCGTASEQHLTGPESQPPLTHAHALLDGGNALLHAAVLPAPT